MFCKVQKKISPKSRTKLGQKKCSSFKFFTLNLFKVKSSLVQRDSICLSHQTLYFPLNKSRFLSYYMPALKMSCMLLLTFIFMNVDAVIVSYVQLIKYISLSYRGESYHKGDMRTEKQIYQYCPSAVMHSFEFTSGLLLHHCIYLIH